MTYCNLLLFLFAVSTNLWITHGLNAERIIGGIPAEQSNFRYQVTIFGEKFHYGQDYSTEIICSGGLIREDLVLSLAFCFLDDEGGLKSHRFFIMAGKANVATVSGTKVYIKRIYMPKVNESYEVVHASVSLLRRNLTFGLLSDYSKLIIPIDADLYHDLGVLIAGSECAQRNDVSLKYIQAEILNEEVINMAAPDFYDLWQGKGWRLARLLNQNSALCKTDAGSPLVFGTSAVGLAVNNFPESSNNNNKLIVYVDGYSISDFVKLAMEESPDPERLLIIDNN